MRANTEIDALLAELIESGVSPKYVSRLAAELDEHCADLEAEARRLGFAAGEISSDARLRLGRCAVIAKEFELRPELKSWVYTSRWLERVLRLLATAYLLARAPARVAAAGQGAVVRYTAATAAGAGVTFCLLLLQTVMISPESQLGMRLMERAGAVLGPWEERPRQRTMRDTRPAAPPSPPDETGDPDPVPEPLLESAETMQPGRGPEGVFDRREFVRRAPPARVTELRLAEALRSSMPPAFEARVVFADIDPATHLGIDGRDFRPILKRAPTYPLAAVRRGIEGHVVVEYTVTRNGLVEDAVIVDSTHPLFERAALDAAREFVYEPRAIRGQAVAVRGVRAVIRFQLEV